MIKRKKLLVIGMIDSIHLARWLELFRDIPIDFLIFSSSPNRIVHSRIQALTKNSSSATFQISLFSRFFSLPSWVMDRILDDALRSRMLSHMLARFKPDIVHAVEFQSAGYLALKSLRRIDAKHRPKLLITNYGSDIFWYQQYPHHLSKIKSLLEIADGYSAECSRDVVLARNYGLTTPNVHVFPNSAGIDAAQLLGTELEANPRTSIAIKGYQGRFGEALIALSVIEAMAKELGALKIEIFSANRSTIRQAKKLSKSTNLSIFAHPKNSLTHSQMLELFRRSILYIGLSKSDGISTSMIEAMSQGCIPIQTVTSCANEWVNDCESGFLVSSSDKPSISGAISKIIGDEIFRKQAAANNLKVIEERYIIEKIKSKAIAFIDSV